MRLRIFCQDHAKVVQYRQMSKNVKFAMNTGGGGGMTIIQDMAEPAVRKAAERIAERADRISGAMRENPNTFEVSEVAIGLPNRRGGRRVYAVVRAERPDGGEAYNLDKQALHLALDAGRMTRLSG